VDAAQAEFLGGPMDGKVIPVDTEPSPRIVMALMLPSEDGEPRARAAVYHLEPSPKDHGPTWLYRFDDPSLHP
jgi:hypothetical protein